MTHQAIAKSPSIDQALHLLEQRSEQHRLNEDDRSRLNNIASMPQSELPAAPREISVLSLLGATTQSNLKEASVASGDQSNNIKKNFLLQQQERQIGRKRKFLEKFRQEIKSILADQCTDKSNQPIKSFPDPYRSGQHYNGVLNKDIKLNDLQNDYLLTMKMDAETEEFCGALSLTSYIKELNNSETDVSKRAVWQLKGVLQLLGSLHPEVMQCINKDCDTIEEALSEVKYKHTNTGYSNSRYGY